MQRFLIIDSNALLHRSFHALPPLANGEGEQTGAIYGFLLTLFKAIKDIKPDFITATFDFPAPTFRHKEFADYKAQRPKTPEELTAQISQMPSILENFNIPVFRKEGFEADDLIASLVRKVHSSNSSGDIEIIILTGDLDTLQLVDEYTKVYTLRKGVKDTIIYNKEKVEEKVKLPPSQVVDFKALAGDASDNIPGVPGIGKKTTTDLLNKFQDLEDLFNKVEEIEKGEVSPKEIGCSPNTIKKLKENKEQAFFSRDLAKARKDVELNLDIESCRFTFDKDKVVQKLRELKFNSLVDKLPLPEENRKVVNNSSGKENTLF